MDLETRIRERCHVGKEDIKKGLMRVGLEGGDTVLVHSSLSSFGYVEGGADTVINSLIEVVGDKGIVAVPSFSFSLKKDGSIFDVANTRSEMGKISEALRCKKNSYRSHHLTHSVSALGYRARELTRTHSVTPCGKESPFRKLINLERGYILLLGVSQNVNTTFHTIEEEKGLFYVRYRELRDTYIINEDGIKSFLPTKVHQPLKKYDFNRMDKLLRESGVMKIGIIGESIIRLINAKGLYRVVCKYLERDSGALLRDPRGA